MVWCHVITFISLVYASDWLLIDHWCPLLSFIISLITCRLLPSRHHFMPFFTLYFATPFCRLRMPHGILSCHALLALLRLASLPPPLMPPLLMPLSPPLMADFSPLWGQSIDAYATLIGRGWCRFSPPMPMMADARHAWRRRHLRRRLMLPPFFFFFFIFFDISLPPLSLMPCRRHISIIDDYFDFDAVTSFCHCQLPPITSPILMGRLAGWPILYSLIFALRSAAVIISTLPWMLMPPLFIDAFTFDYAISSLMPPPAASSAISFVYHLIAYHWARHWLMSSLPSVTPHYLRH